MPRLSSERTGRPANLRFPGTQSDLIGFLGSVPEQVPVFVQSGPGTGEHKSGKPKAESGVNAGHAPAFGFPLSALTFRPHSRTSMRLSGQIGRLFQDKFLLDAPQLNRNGVNLPDRRCPAHCHLANGLPGVLPVSISRCVDVAVEAIHSSI